jgi:hypothetical protein
MGLSKLITIVVFVIIKIVESNEPLVIRHIENPQGSEEFLGNSIPYLRPYKTNYLLLP